MLEVRRTTSDDPGFRTLVAALDDELWQRYPDVQAEYAPHNAVDHVATAVVVVDGGLPIGCGCFKPRAPGTVELKRMFVTPGARGRGVAGQIVQALEQWARELGNTAMVLETGNNQPEAVALYTRQGFVQVPRFEPYVDMPTSLCMRKTL